VEGEHGGLELHAAFGRRLWTFAEPYSPMIGSDGDCDIVIKGEQVQPRHARLDWGQEGWTFVELAAAPTASADGASRDTARIGPGDELRLRLGSPDGPLLRLGCTATGPRSRRRVISLGRDERCDVALGDPLVSRRHALVEISDRAMIVDLDSHNGTYVNGKRVHEPKALEPGDVVGVGGTELTFTGATLAQVVRTPALSARQLSVVAPGGAQLLDDVSVTVAAGQVMAVIGPSGAGKSTLLNALTGLRPATSGNVSWNGQDLYAEYERLRLLIGLVPQEDILHRQLTVRRALQFAAGLRLPPDTTRKERDERIAEVLEEVELLDQFNQRIDSLSGGQRKRTSMALELLTAPQLLFLDEPTSGLDAGLDRRVMQRMRALADAGRVVVVVTHSVLALDQCDRVLLLATGGQVAFFGPPSELLDFFGVEDYPSVFLAIEDPSWVDAYARSEARAAYVGRTGAVARPVLDVPEPHPSLPTRVRQLRTLVRRDAAVIAADRGRLVLMVAMPLVLAAMSRALPGERGLAVQGASIAGGEAQSRLLVLVAGAALMGTAMSVREIVAERPIFRREHAVGLSVASYLGSKVVVLGTVVAFQAATLTLLSLAGLPGPVDPLVLPSGTLEVTAAVAALAVTMTLAGLAVSGMVRSSEQSMPALVAVVMAQLVFCGALFPIEGRAGLEQFSWLFPGRFSFAATAATAGGSDVRAPAPDPWLQDVLGPWLPDVSGARARGLDPLWEHTAAQWFTDMALLGAQAVVLALLASWAVSRSVRRGH
jgi:ABC-type multidrug transport system ATPase subunit